MAKHISLPPDQEKKFKDWYAGYASENDLDPNPDDLRHKYDYRAFFQAMLKDPQAYRPERDPSDSNRMHLSSEFKDDDHPRRFLRINGKTVDTKHEGGEAMAYTNEDETYGGLRSSTKDAPPKSKGNRLKEGLKKVGRGFLRGGAKKKQSPAEIIKNTKEKMEDTRTAEARLNPDEPEYRDSPKKASAPSKRVANGETDMEQAMMAKPSGKPAATAKKPKDGVPAKKREVDPGFRARHEARMKASAYRSMGKDPIADVVKASTAETMANHSPSKPMAATMSTHQPFDPTRETPQEGRRKLTRSLEDTGGAAIDQALSAIGHLVEIGLLSKAEAEAKRADALNSMKRKAKALIN